MESPAKRQKCCGDAFESLSRILCWDEIEVNKVFKVVKQLQDGRALLINNIGERLITDLPEGVFNKLSQEDLTIYLKKTPHDVIVAFKPRKMCVCVCTVRSFMQLQVHLLCINVSIVRRNPCRQTFQL